MSEEYNKEILREVKLFKGILDMVQDELLLLIISESKQRILSYINAKRLEPLKEIPKALDYIVRDIAIKRFNKIDSEGASSNSEEGMKYDWDKSYFSEYYDILDQYSDKEGTERRGSIKFI